LAQPEIRANLLEGAVEAVRQGSRGLAMELRLLFVRPWGFRPEDVQRAVRLWYGEADALVPLETARYLASALPHAHLTLCPGQGHLLYVPRWAEILRTLAAA
jgi:pimeloyl-ACP methyl ester carboxylesterase